MASSSSAQQNALNAEHEEAMEKMAKWAFEGSKSFPSTLKKYLETHDFMCLPPPKVAISTLHPFKIHFYLKIKVEGYPDGTVLESRSPEALIPATEKGWRLMAYFVKMVPRIGDRAIQTFSASDFISLDLSNPSARLVVTTQLSGCSFVIGYDKSIKTILHLGHAQPSQGDDRSHSADLLKQFKTASLNSIFQGKELKKVEVLGGFGSTKVKVLGWISNGKLYIACKIMETPKQKFKIYEYP